MITEEKVLTELNEVKAILAKLAGTSELPDAEKFSTDALNKAAKEFKKMMIQRGEWVKESDIGKFLKGADWRAGKFIREEFHFSQCIRDGHYFMYNKVALLELAKELKEKETLTWGVISITREVKLNSRKRSKQIKTRVSGLIHCRKMQEI